MLKRFLSVALAAYAALWAQIASAQPVYGTNGQSSAAEASHVLKTGVGSLYGFSVTAGATPGYVLLFDLAAAPSNGAVTPAGCFVVGANSTVGVQFSPAPNWGFINGAVLVFSTTGCFTQTTSATAYFRWTVQ